MSIHSGHRERLKERFRKEGLDNFEELYVLELLLFYCIPRKDTNELAHRLLDRFGSLVNVLDATPSELEKVPGIGKNVSTFLSLHSAVERYYERASHQEKIVSTVDEYGSFMTRYFKKARNEMVYLLSLDAKCKVLSCSLVGEGSVNSASVPIRRIVEMALADNATSVILAHNHPSGLALPSNDDVQTTYRLAQALEGVDICLVDHLVITADDYVSMAQSGYYRPIAALPR